MTFRFVLQNKNAILLTVLEIERTIYIGANLDANGGHGAIFRASLLGRFLPDDNKIPPTSRGQIRDIHGQLRWKLAVRLDENLQWTRPSATVYQFAQMLRFSRDIRGTGSSRHRL